MSSQGAGVGATERFPRRVSRQQPTRPPPSSDFVELVRIYDAVRALNVERFPPHERHKATGLLEGIRSLAAWYRTRVLECRAP